MSAGDAPGTILGARGWRGAWDEGTSNAQHIPVEIYPLSPEDAASPGSLFSVPLQKALNPKSHGGTVAASPSRMSGLASASLPGLGAALPLWDRAGISHIQQQPLPSAQYGFSHELLLAQYGG